MITRTRGTRARWHRRTGTRMHAALTPVPMSPRARLGWWLAWCAFTTCTVGAALATFRLSLPLAGDRNPNSPPTYLPLLLALGVFLAPWWAFFGHHPKPARTIGQELGTAAATITGALLVTLAEAVLRDVWITIAAGTAFILAALGARMIWLARHYLPASPDRDRPRSAGGAR